MNKLKYCKLRIIDIVSNKKLLADEEAVTLQAGYATFILQKTVYKTSVFTLTKNVKVS